MIFLRVLAVFTLMIAFSAQANLDEGQRAYEAEDYLSAFGLFKEAAKDGDAKAQFLLAESYFNGRGTPQDFSLAIKWYTASAEQEFVQAQERLGNLYLSGKFIPQDVELGAMWFSRAAKQGNINAALIAGGLYF